MLKRISNRISPEPEANHQREPELPKKISAHKPITANTLVKDIHKGDTFTNEFDDGIAGSTVDYVSIGKNGAKVYLLGKTNPIVYLSKTNDPFDVDNQTVMDSPIGRVSGGKRTRKNKSRRRKNRRKSNRRT
jgi:hypothetical protein